MTKKQKTSDIKMADVKIIKKGNKKDCSHHEILQMREDGVEVGLCIICSQEREYTLLNRGAWGYGQTIKT